MAFDPLQDLRNILTRRQASEGRITAISGRNATVSTAVGVISAQIPDELSLKKGDRVRLNGRSVVSKIPGSDLPVFTL